MRVVNVLLLFTSIWLLATIATCQQPTRAPRTAKTAPLGSKNPRSQGARKPKPSRFSPKLATQSTVITTTTTNAPTVHLALNDETPLQETTAIEDVSTTARDSVGSTDKPQAQEFSQVSTAFALSDETDDQGEFLRVGPMAKSRPPVRSMQTDGTPCGQCTLFTSGKVELDCYGLALSQSQFAQSYSECQDSLANVKALYLGANSIGDIGNDAFLQSFGGLEELYLADSDVGSLDSDAFQNTPYLKVLDLRGNLLSSLSGDVFDKTPNIRVIRLGGNILRGANAQLFASLADLTELDLSANGITDVSGLSLSANTQLAVLDLSNNRIKQITGDILALQNLKVVNLANNQLTQAAVESINWYPNASLSLLDLSASGLTTIPKKLPMSVDLLILSYNRITRLDQAQLQSTRTFNSFSIRLDNNNLLNIPVETFQNAFNIIGLDVSYNQLSAVPRVLPRNLIHLNISNNFINATFAQLTANTRFLAYLNLSNNRLVALRTGVLNNGQVYRIDLSNNNIATVERQSVQNMPQLLRLELRSNPISRIDRSAFGDLPRLSELDMSNCTSRSMQLMNPVFNDLRSLRKLNVSNCPALCNYTIMHFESLSNRNYDTTLNTARMSSTSRLDQLFELDLSSCQLRTISIKFLDEVMVDLPQLYNLYLNNNPWHCDVYLWAVIEKMRSINSKLYNLGDYVCASPPALRGKSLLWLTVNELLAGNPSQAREAASLGLFAVDEYPPDCRCGDCNCTDKCSCDGEIANGADMPADGRSRNARRRVVRSVQYPRRCGCKEGKARRQ